MIMISTTAVYDGRKYLLSYPFRHNVTKSQSICKALGGYLIEFRTRADYEVTKDVIKKSGTNERVWVGLTDAGHEGHWKFMEHPTKGAPFFPWYPGEPNGRRSQDCASLILSKGVFLLGDVACSYSSPIRFMCEVLLP